MKRFYNYTFQLVCVYILVLTLFSIFNFSLTKTNYNKKSYNVDSQKVLDSTLLAQSLGEDAETEESIKEETNEEVKEEQVNQVITQPVVETSNYVDTSGYAVLAHETINMSHYGHDCIGCGSGYVSSGYYVGDGRLYYNDPTFGNVRIVAADYKYPEGTIVRLSYNGNSFPAIVLDRGGAIGDHGRYQIDLLASSEYEANQVGSVFGVSLDVLRYGY